MPCCRKTNNETKHREIQQKQTNSQRMKVNIKLKFGLRQQQRKYMQDLQKTKIGVYKKRLGGTQYRTLVTNKSSGLL